MVLLSTAKRLRMFTQVYGVDGCTKNEVVSMLSGGAAYSASFVQELIDEEVLVENGVKKYKNNNFETYTVDHDKFREVLLESDIYSAVSEIEMKDSKLLRKRFGSGFWKWFMNP